MTSDLDIVYDSTLYFASLASITFLSASTFSSFEALYETCAWLKAAKYDDQQLNLHRGRRRLTVLRGFLELLEQLVPILILPQAGVLMRAVSDVSDQCEGGERYKPHPEYWASLAPGMPRRQL